MTSPQDSVIFAKLKSTGGRSALQVRFWSTILEQSTIKVGPANTSALTMVIQVASVSLVAVITYVPSSKPVNIPVVLVPTTAGPLGPVSVYVKVAQEEPTAVMLPSMAPSHDSSTAVTPSIEISHGPANTSMLTTSLQVGSLVSPARAR